jgi:DNA polymerase-3 subunit delta
MPTQAFDPFFKTLRKGDVPGAIYLYGPEEVLKDEAIGEILERTVDPSLRDFNLDQRSATTLDPEGAEIVCNTLPMMADRRVVIIRDVEAWNKRAKAKAVVLEYLSRPAADTILILVQGAAEEGADPDLAAKTVAVAAQPLAPDRAKRWLLHQAGRLKVPLEDLAAEHMVKVADGSLSFLRSELDKLSGLADGAPLTIERVSQFLGVLHGETQYDWRDAVLEGSTARALSILPRVLAQSGVSGVSLVSLLGTSIAGIGLARAHLDRGTPGGPALAQAVKNSLFKARPARVNYDAAAAQWSRLVRGWSRSRVEGALGALLAADQRLKSTTVADEGAILFDLVMELTGPCLLPS